MILSNVSVVTIVHWGKRLFHLSTPLDYFGLSIHPDYLHGIASRVIRGDIKLINLVKLFLQLDTFSLQLPKYLSTLFCGGRGITEMFSCAGGNFSPFAEEFISEIEKSQFSAVSPTVRGHCFQTFQLEGQRVEKSTSSKSKL